MPFPANLKKKITHLLNVKHLNVSYSQEGEDLLIDRVLGYKKTGLYVDVGAYHPIKFSNTYKFYLKGWRGINIDAMPGSMAAFAKVRPRDINIETPVSDCASVLTYHIFNEGALNTFSAEEAAKKDGLGSYKLLRTLDLPTRRLDEILNEKLGIEDKIDFMSIDVEGLDLSVLRSNNWIKFRPALVLVENLESSNNLEAALKGETSMFMQSVDFVPFAKTYNTLFFVDGTQNNMVSRKNRSL